MWRQKISALTLMIIVTFIASHAHADTAGMQTFFEPMVQIILDKTGTMQVGPLGSTSSRFSKYPECTSAAAADYSLTYDSTTYKYDCSRMAIAQRTIFKILDYNNDGVLSDADKTGWKLKVGASQYWWAGPDQTGGTSDDNYVQQVGGVNDSYQKLMCGSQNTSQSCNQAKVDTYSTSSATASCFNTPCLADKTTGGGTNTVQALGAAKTYLDGFNSGDDACRKKYVVLITDGTDNKGFYSSVGACGPASEGVSGTGKDCDEKMTHKWRREMVLKVKELADAGYRVYVVGFATGLPTYLTSLLNWMGLWGNPASTEAMYPSAAIKPSTIEAIRSSACVYSDSATIANPTCLYQQVTGDTTVNVTNFFASTNDPGYADYAAFKTTYSQGDAAYFAQSPAALASALKGVLGAIFSDNYSFTQSSIQAVRDEQESFAYEGSFEAALNDPFWIGHLKKFPIDYATGAISSTPSWDAGLVLRGTSAANRKIYTYIGGAVTEFTTANITMSHLAAADETNADLIVNFIRGGDTAYGSGDFNAWKLGDITNSAPMTIGTPNSLFYDKWDTTGTAFSDYRAEHARSSAAGTRMILQGANDGQMHLFKTSDGSEVWSFIPPNLLPKLKNIAHTVHPPATLVPGTTLMHTMFVNGPTAAAEVWIDPISTGTSLCSSGVCGIAKVKGNWKTYFVLSEGNGAAETLWSSSVSCDSGFSTLYSGTYTNYCGIYAFDISDTSSISSGGATPTLLWRPGWKVGDASSSLTAQDGAHLAQPWGKMFMGRVRESNTEKWVGLIGGGFSGGEANTCPNSPSSACTAAQSPGKGFFVINLKDGYILWRATHNDGAGSLTTIGGYNMKNMDYDLAAPAMGIDSDGDGFMDRAYMGDIGGNVWRFTFCTAAQDSAGTCTTANWTVSEIYHNSSGNIVPIYTAITAAKDTTGQIWLYWGTGDKTEASASNAQENFIALKEDLTRPQSNADYFKTSDLDSIGNETGTGTYNGTKQGWILNFTGGGEKLLGDPVVFEDVVYFTSYIPRKSGDPCTAVGTAKIYGVNYVTGAGAFDTDGDGTPDSKGQTLGSGVATGVTVSRGPSGVNIYSSTSSGTPHTIDVPNVPAGNAANSSVIYWHDMRISN